MNGSRTVSWTVVGLAAVLALAACSSEHTGSERTATLPATPQQQALLGYLGTMKAVQQRREELLDREDKADYRRLRYSAKNAVILTAFRHAAQTYARLSRDFAALASMTERVRVPASSLDPAHLAFVRSLRLSAERDGKFSRDLRRGDYDAISGWQDWLGPRRNRIFRLRTIWRRSVIGRAKKVGIVVPSWVREVGLPRAHAPTVRSNRDPLSDYLSAADTLFNHAPNLDPYAVVTATLPDVVLTFDDWYTAVIRFVNGDITLAELQKASDMASFVASEAAGKAARKQRLFGKACSAALGRYSRTMRVYAQTLGSGIANEAYAFAAQAGQHVLEVCKAR